MFKVNVEDKQLNINDSFSFKSREDAMKYANKLRDLKVTMVEVIDCSRDACIFRSVRTNKIGGDANANN